MPSKFPNFLKIACFSRTEVTKVNDTTSVVEEIFDDVDHKLAEILAEKLKFSYEFISPADGEYGRHLPDGKWSGMVGMIERGEADLIIYRLSMTNIRTGVIDYSYPYHLDRQTFATLNPELSVNIGSFLKPFSFSVWISILVCIFTVPFIYFILFGRKLSCLTIVSNSSLEHSNSLSKRIFKACCMISSMFLRFFYMGMLLSFLTIPSYVGVKTLADLAAAVAEGRYRCVTTPGSFTLEALLLANDSEANIIGKSLNENDGTTNIEEVLGSNSSSTKPAFLELETFLLMFQPKYFVSDDVIFIHLRAIGLKKNFCCKKPLNIVISRIWSAGIYRKLLNDAIFTATIKNGAFSSKTNKRSERQLSLRDFEGVFVLLLGGYILSTIVFICEIFFSKFRLAKMFGIHQK